MKERVKKQIRNAIRMYRRRIEKGEKELEKEENKNKNLTKTRWESIINTSEKQIEKCERALAEINNNNLKPAFNILTEVIRIKRIRSWVPGGLKKTYLELGESLEKDEYYLEMMVK